MVYIKNTRFILRGNYEIETQINSFKIISTPGHTLDHIIYFNNYIVNSCLFVDLIVHFLQSNLLYQNLNYCKLCHCIILISILN